VEQIITVQTEMAHKILGCSTEREPGQGRRGRECRRKKGFHCMNLRLPFKFKSKFVNKVQLVQTEPGL
jgi:hypothetical protein